MASPFNSQEEVSTSYPLHTMAMTFSKMARMKGDGIRG